MTVTSPAGPGPKVPPGSAQRPYWFAADNRQALGVDEPAAGLAGAEASALVEFLLRQRDRAGMAVLLVEHDLPVVAGADRVIVINAPA